MRFSLPLLTLAGLASTVQAAPERALEYAQPVSFPTFSQNTIFVPPRDYTDPQVLYARTVELEKGVLLSTWENYSPEPPMVYFPIFKSVDGGATWKEISRIQDTVNGWGLRYQPDLYRLTHRVGNFPKGTIIASGNSLPTDLSKTKIDVYVSLDEGYTWKFVSSVATGGEGRPLNGLTPVWEPFVMYYKGQVVLYFSDQRDPAHGQKLVHVTTKDLYNWSPLVEDVVNAPYGDRPGMTTVTRLPNGKWMMTYENGGGRRPSGNPDYSFPVYYRIADSPLKFLSAPAIPIWPNDRTEPLGSPYVVWTPVGGRDGTIIVSDGTNGRLFINQALGAENAWRTIPCPESPSYTRHLRVLSDQNHLLVIGGGKTPPSTTNRIRLSVMDISAALKQAS